MVLNINVNVKQNCQTYKEHLLNFELEYINTKLFFTCTANNTETSLLKKKQY